MMDQQTEKTGSKKQDVDDNLTIKEMMIAMMKAMRGLEGEIESMCYDVADKMVKPTSAGYVILCRAQCV